ncbi:TPA_asm: WXG-100 motif and Tde-like DNAse [Mycobacterium phage McProf]|uniref:hypothetical protein n=1 Tax=Mycobacteroides chelonae TaxID=1774 RepID=UPI0007B44ACD|nr:hypothetical protein [Mycobacteroides chelonae]ANA97700.1 hypothetical protein BB28_08100 [Mycobacteroides chelonae CCUG 47445]DAZ90085.1 TPA_asm: WXG-100 motif and Tde-like DNAse [Mycobacterium phage McProf]
MTPLDEFMAKKANDYMTLLDRLRPRTAALKANYDDDYKRWATTPDGTYWSGQFAGACQEAAADDCKGTDNADDTIADAASLMTATITYSVLPNLTGGQNLIERVLAHADKGVSIDQNYQMHYTPTEGESDDSIARNRAHVADTQRQIEEYVGKWEKADAELKSQADAAREKMLSRINPKAALVDGRKILRDAATPKPGDPNATTVNYKEMYPKATDPASTQAAAATAADPHAPVLGPPSPGDKPFQPDPRAGGLTDKLGVMGITEPKSPLDKPPPPPDARTVPAPKLDPNTPQGKAAIDKFRSILATQYPPDQVEAKLSEAIKGAQQDRPMVATPEPGTPERVRQSGGEAFAEKWDQSGRAKDDLLGINGGDHAKEAWKGVAKGLWDVVNPDPVHQVERGIDQAKGAIDEVKSGIDNPKAFIGKHGIEIAAGIATAPVGGEGALLGTEGRALTHGLEDAAPGHPPTPHGAEPHTPVTGHAPTEPPSGPTHPTPTVDHPAPAVDHPGGDHGIPSSIEHAAGLPRSADDILNDSRAAHRLERDQLDWDRGEQNLADLAAHHGVSVDELPRTPQYDIHHPTYTDKIAADHSAEIDRHTQMWEHGYNTQSVQQVLDNMDAPRQPTTDLRNELRQGLNDYGYADLINAGHSPADAKRLAGEYAEAQFPREPGLIPQPVIHNPDGAGGGYTRAYTYGDWQVNNALGNLTKQEKDALRAFLETQPRDAIVNIRLTDGRG